MKIKALTMSDGTEGGPVQRCFDWHQGEQLQRARQADEHAVQGGAAGAASRLVYHLFARGRVVVEDEARYSVVEASVRELAAALECSTSTAWQAAQYWMERGVMARRTVIGRSEWLLSWSAFWAFGRVRSCSAAFGGVRSCSAVFGGVRSCSAAFGGVRSDDNREGKPRMIPQTQPQTTFLDSDLTMTSTSTTSEDLRQSLGELIGLLWGTNRQVPPLDEQDLLFLTKLAALRILIDPPDDSPEWLDGAALAFAKMHQRKRLENPIGYLRTVLVNRLHEGGHVARENAAGEFARWLGMVAGVAAAGVHLLPELLADRSATQKDDLNRQREAAALAARRPKAEEVAEIKSSTAECRRIMKRGKAQAFRKGNRDE